VFHHQIWNPFVRFIFNIYGTRYILRRKFLLKHVIEGRVYGTGRRDRKSKQLLDDLKVTRRFWKLKTEALDRTLWKAGFGRGYEPVVRQTA
jgi:hypothetical protein